MSSVIILVEPEEPLNVGFVVRAMKGFGLSELRVVHSSWKQIPDPAKRTGVCAVELIDSARIFPNLSSALSDLDFSVALSRRQFDVEIPNYWLNELPSLIQDFKKCGYVFGRESQGLTQTEINQCHSIASIPILENLSFNLGQAVAITLYELFGRMQNPKPKNSDSKIATHGQIEALIQLLNKNQVDDNRSKAIRELLHRAIPTETEIKSLFGKFKY